MKRTLGFIWGNAVIGLCLGIQFLIFYLSHYNDGKWLVNLLSYGIPLLLLLEIGLTITLMLQKRWLVCIGSTLLGLFLLPKAVSETISLNFWFEQKSDGLETLDILTFNASTFNKNRKDPFVSDDSLFKGDFFHYLSQNKDSLEIMCIQEFHHDDAEDDRILDKIVSITGMGYYYTVPIWQSVQYGFFGIITFSKYPIIGGGTLFVGEESTLNRGIFTDIVFQEDTIRVINIHLHSMSIRVSLEDSLSYNDRANDVFGKLRAGSTKSKKQIEQVVKAIERSPYPVIVCGDFNTFPYGYAYQEVKKRLQNSFEKAGRGFGFTLNIFPYLVRVDNLFHSKELHCVESKVERRIELSDHFPVLAKFYLKKSRFPTAQDTTASH